MGAETKAEPLSLWLNEETKRAFLVMDVRRGLVYGWQFRPDAHEGQRVSIDRDTFLADAERFGLKLQGEVNDGC